MSSQFLPAHSHSTYKCWVRDARKRLLAYSFSYQVIILFMATIPFWTYLDYLTTISSKFQKFHAHCIKQHFALSVLNSPPTTLIECHVVLVLWDLASNSSTFLLFTAFMIIETSVIFLHLLFSKWNLQLWLHYLFFIQLL